MTKPDRLELRTVAEADVYLGDDLVAHLVRESADTISFNYVADDARPTLVSANDLCHGRCCGRVHIPLSPRVAPFPHSSPDSFRRGSVSAW